MKLNSEGLVLQKMKYMNLNSKIDEKNGVICLVIMFTPWFMVIKMSQMARFLHFAGDSNRPVTVWTKYLSASEKSRLALLEIGMDHWVLSNH